MLPAAGTCGSQRAIRPTGATSSNSTRPVGSNGSIDGRDSVSATEVASGAGPPMASRDRLAAGPRAGHDGRESARGWVSLRGLDPALVRGPAWDRRVRANQTGAMTIAHRPPSARQRLRQKLEQGRVEDVGRLERCHVTGARHDQEP